MNMQKDDNTQQQQQKKKVSARMRQQRRHKRMREEKHPSAETCHNQPSTSVPISDGLNGRNKYDLMIVSILLYIYFHC